MEDNDLIEIKKLKEIMEASYFNASKNLDNINRNILGYISNALKNEVPSNRELIELPLDVSDILTKNIYTIRSADNTQTIVRSIFDSLKNQSLRKWSLANEALIIQAIENGWVSGPPFRYFVKLAGETANYSENYLYISNMLGKRSRKVITGKIAQGLIPPTYTKKESEEFEIHSGELMDFAEIVQY